MLRSQAFGADRCFLRACYSKHLHHLYSHTGRVGGIGCRRQAENNSDSDTYWPVWKISEITLNHMMRGWQMHQDAQMEQWWVKARLRRSVMNASKDSIVAPRSAEPAWLSLHGCFVNTQSSIWRNKIVYKDVYFLYNHH